MHTFAIKQALSSPHKYIFDAFPLGANNKEKSVHGSSWIYFVDIFGGDYYRIDFNLVSEKMVSSKGKQYVSYFIRYFCKTRKYCLKYCLGIFKAPLKMLTNKIIYVCTLQIAQFIKKCM